MNVVTDNRWQAARLMGLVSDVNDQCERVARNGPEPVYAEEKLGFALRQLARALAIIGMTPSEIRDAADTAAQSELDRW